MKKIFILFVLFSSAVFSQENKDTNAFEVSLFRGNVLPHTPDLYHLSGHPEGVMISALRQTHGAEKWHSAYNYPDYGAYFVFQDYKNSILGKTYGVGGQYNFYFLNRHLELKLCQGIAYATNPYDKETNSKNKAFGSKFMANTNIGLYYKKENIIDGFGLQTGFLFTHCSNGRTKSPNSGINTYSFNLGINYNFNESKTPNPTPQSDTINYREPIHYNFVLRTGVNESPIIGSGQHPFYHIGIFADKRLNRKSVLQLGADLFLTQSFKDFIRYKANAYPELNIDPNTDYKRIGVFVGYEMIVNRIGINIQVGNYVYRPFVNDVSIYDRVGFNYHFNKHIYGAFSVKTHLFLAEALEFGVGYKL